jgi:hypothetical protein
MYLLTYTVQYEGATIEQFDTLEEAREAFEKAKRWNCNGDYRRFRIFKAELLHEED